MFLTKGNSLVHKIVDQLIVKESVIVFHREVYFLVGPRTPLQRRSDYPRRTRPQASAARRWRTVFSPTSANTRPAGTRTQRAGNRGEEAREAATKAVPESACR